MYRVRMAIFLSFACLISIFSQTTYYISSSQGNDANPGTSDSSPWKTISKVNNAKFLPGDNILFKRGDKWAEGLGLKINNSGTENNRITYGAYGTGNKPILSQEREIIGLGAWTNIGTNLWRKTVTGFNGNPRKLWLDEVSVKSRGYGNEVIGSSGSWHVTPNITNLSQVTTLSSEYRFGMYAENIDLYCVGEPSATYGSIKIAYEQPIIFIKNNNYITIQDIKVERCYRAIEIFGSSYITLDSIDIYDTYSSGLYIYKSNGRKSNYLEVKNCYFNSGVGDVEGKAYEYYYAQGSFAINLSSGDYANIHDNTFENFHHTNGLVIGSGETGDSLEVRYCEFYDNVLDMSKTNYGRAFTIGGSEIRCHDNRIYRNLIIHNNLNIELSGYHNYFYYNIIYNDTSRGHYDEGELICLNWLTLSGFPGATNTDNYYFNNTFYNCKNSAIVDFGKRNSGLNNLFINYNVNQWSNRILDLIDSKGGAIYKNNKFYSPYIDHSGREVYYNGTNYSISSWNSADVSGDDIFGNEVLSSNPITSTSTFEVFGEGVVDGGIDISSYVPIGFKDREGNLVDRANPNIGAIDNSSQEPSGLQIYLQGAFTNGIMKTALNQGGLIPKAQPYNISPWNYNGNEFAQTIPADIVDWVLIELRSNISPSSIVAKRAAFVRNDGSIVDLDGTSKLHFDAVGSGNYYVVIKHRNHLSLMSAVQVPISGSSIQYDFTASRSGVYGNDLTDLSNGKYGMYAGDGDANDTVNVLDYGTVGNNLFQTGYFQGDLDLNGTTNVLDYGKANQNLLKVSNVP